MMIPMLNLTLFVSEILIKQCGRWVLFAVCQAYILNEGKLLIRYFAIHVFSACTICFYCPFGFTVYNTDEVYHQTKI